VGNCSRALFTSSTGVAGQQPPAVGDAPRFAGAA
jgi:hypothetical protein